MVAADVKESPQNSVIASNNENWLTSDFTGDILSRFAHLIRAPEHVPRTGEDRAML
jgi:hypothetical protein